MILPVIDGFTVSAMAYHPVGAATFDSLPDNARYVGEDGKNYVKLAGAAVLDPTANDLVQRVIIDINSKTATVEDDLYHRSFALPENRYAMRVQASFHNIEYKINAVLKDNRTTVDTSLAIPFNENAKLYLYVELLPIAKNPQPLVSDSGMGLLDGAGEELMSSDFDLAGMQTMYY